MGSAIPQEKRPSRSLTGLGVSFGVLEALDVYATVRGVNNGYAEANPLLRGSASHPFALATLKSLSAASTILLTRRLARRHRPAALVMMTAVNAAYATIVAHNMRLAGR